MADESAELLRKWLNGEDEALAAWLAGSGTAPRSPLAVDFLLAEGGVQGAAAEIVALLTNVRRLRWAKSRGPGQETGGSAGPGELLPAGWPAANPRSD